MKYVICTFESITWVGKVTIQPSDDNISVTWIERNNEAVVLPVNVSYVLDGTHWKEHRTGLQLDFDFLSEKELQVMKVLAQ